MKKVISLILVLISMNLYSQEYSFNRKLVSVKYVDSKGNKKQSTISKTDNSYKISFEKATDPRNSPIISIYNDNDESGYYAFSKKFDNTEIGGYLYECNLFYSTERSDGVTIYFAFDKSHFIIVYQDKIVEYFNLELMKKNRK